MSCLTKKEIFWRNMEKRREITNKTRKENKERFRRELSKSMGDQAYSRDADRVLSEMMNAGYFDK